MNAEAQRPGLAVLLLHGLCSTPSELMPVSSALRSAGHAVHDLNIDGYSFTAGEEQRASPWQGWVSSVNARVRELRAEHGRVMLVGLSAGTSLALASLDGCSQDLDGVVLLSTSLRYDGWAVSRWRFLLPLALYTPLGLLWRYHEKPPYGVKNERVRAWIAEELRLRRVSSAGAAVIGRDFLREIDRLNRWLRPRLCKLRGPAMLAVQARDDEVAGPANLSLLSDGLACTSLRTVVLDNSYHMITIDNDRREVVRETVAFANRLAA